MQASAAESDLGGRTALLLLAPASASARSLFVLSATEGVVCFGRGERPRSIRFAPGALPFADRAFDSVVIDAEGPRMTEQDRRSLLDGVDRVLNPCGRCILVASHRRIPRSRRTIAEYRVVPDDAQWHAALSSYPELRDVDSLFAQLDGPRLVQVLTPHGATPQPSRAADRRIRVLGRSTLQRDSVIDALLAELNPTFGHSSGRIRLDRFLVRRIGKTTLGVSSGDGRQFLIRLPRSPIAEERARRNFSALRAFHDAPSIPARLKALVPRAYTDGTIGGYHYFVEDTRPGRAREDHADWSSKAGWEPQAASFISEMHFASRRAVPFGRDEFDTHVARPIGRIRARLPSKAAVACDRLETALERVLIGRMLPLVWAHGDFAAGNCLYDSSRTLSGVVDWELSSECHLPVLDLLHCMELPGEQNSHPRWQRFDAILAVAQKESWTKMPPLASYIETMEIPAAALPALAVMYWVDHAANRIAARAADTGWMQRRVLQPLSDLTSLRL